MFRAPLLLSGLLMLFALSGVNISQAANAGQSKETRISGQTRAADGGLLIGMVAIETGKLYSQKFRFGGLVDDQGKFSVKVPEGGSYGLHLYASGYIYSPVSIEVETGKDNFFTLAAPPNPAGKDSPVISAVSFTPEEDNPERILIQLNVHDPNDNLSHQVLGVNIRTQQAFKFTPPKFVWPWARNYPNGIYTLNYATQGRPFDPLEWQFVAADNRCYNSAVLRHPFNEQGIVPARITESVSPAATTAGATKTLDESAMLTLGQQTFADNCAVCHYADKEKTKVGPGLKGLFARDLTPIERLPVNDANIRKRILNGGAAMPPYGHITEPALSALLRYLKTL